MGIRWQDHIPNLKVLDQAKSTSIEATIIKAQLRWVGHVIRMGECWMPWRLMYGELQAGKRNQGRPKLRYKDTVKANLQWCHINPRDLEGSCHGQTKMARLGSQSCCQLQRGSMSETHSFQREKPQSSLGGDHNWLPVPPLFKTLCLWAVAAEPPPGVQRWTVERRRHHWIPWTTTIN